MSGNILVRNVRPYGEGDPVDVRILNGIIVDMSPGQQNEDIAQVEGGGHVLLPGFVDMHVHLREPGREDAETIETGSASAAAGGFTAVMAMPNTDPVADTPWVCDFLWRRGQEVGLVDVHPVGAVTVGQKGERLAEFAAMAAGEAKVRMFSDDGHCVADPMVMRRALEYATDLGAIIAQHAEDSRLVSGAGAHEGAIAARLGLGGWSRAAEESIIARDALLARDVGARIHVCHVSTAGGAALVKWAKEQGIEMTAEVTPHHLLLDDTHLESYDTVYKVNPPLREHTDIQSLRQALADGIIDAVATDHAPHAARDKQCEFSGAKPGMLGLETSLSILLETMVRPGLLTWRGLARVMSENPARIVGLSDHGRPLAVGEPGNLVIVNPDQEWTVQGSELHSLSRNTPYESMLMRGRAEYTILRGVITAYQGKAGNLGQVHQ